MRSPPDFEPADDARPFVDPKTGSVDLTRLAYEARPIAEIALVFAVLAAVVTVPVWVLFDPLSLLGRALLGLSQLIGGVGVAVAALYVLVRAMHLAGGAPRRRSSSAETDENGDRRER